MTPESTRREDILTRPIRLSDGAYWGFSRPAVRLLPQVLSGLDRLGRPVERVNVGMEFGYPVEVERLISRVRSTCDPELVREQYEAFFSLAARLLIRAHDIDLSTACALLSVSEDELPRLVREIMTVVSEANSPGGNDS